MLHTRAVLLAFSAASHGRSAGYETAMSPFYVCGVSAAVSHATPLPAPVTECGWVCGYACGSRSVVSFTLKELDSIHSVCETFTDTRSLSVGLS